MAPVPTPYTSLANYRLILELGRGGMATVFLAAGRGPGGFKKLQVMKILHEEFASDPEFITMFLDEAKLAARINHPNIVHTVDVGHDGSNYYIGMEYLEGRSLEALLRRTKDEMPLGLMLRILIDALEGLGHAHDLTDFDGKPLNVVHRDVSPQNVFVTYSGITKILDFGIAKASDSTGQTKTGVIKGKVTYMAPEQVRGHAVDRRADVFSVGVMLWRALAKRRLWKDATDIEIVHTLVQGEIPSPLTVQPDAPPELVAICMKALSLNAENRYASAADMQEALEGYIRTSGIAKPTTRELGAYLSELFAEQRAKVCAVIDQQIRALKGDEPAIRSVPQLHVMAGSPSSASSPSLPSFGETSGRSVSASVNASGGRTSNDSDDTRTATSEVSRTTARSNKRPMLVYAVTLAAAAFVGTFFVSRSMLDTQEASSTPSAHAARSTIDIDFDGAPAEARLFIDEEPVGPHVQRTRDDARHWVRAEAPGYRRFVELVGFNGPAQTIRVSMQKK